MKSSAVLNKLYHSHTMGDCDEIILDLGLAPNPMTGVLISKERESWETHRGEGQMKMDSKIGVMRPKAKKCQGMPEATRSQEGDMERILCGASGRN